jgi:hypothetical protein
MIFGDEPIFNERLDIESDLYSKKFVLHELDKALDLLESVWNGCDAQNEQTVGAFLKKYGRKI